MIQLLCYSENSAHPLSSVLALKRRYIDTTEVGQREAQLRGNLSNVGNGTTLSECIKASPPSPAAAVPWIAIKTSLFVSDCNWTHVRWLSKSNCTSTCQKNGGMSNTRGNNWYQMFGRDKSDSCHSVPFIHPSRFQTSTNISKMAKSDFPGKLWQHPSSRGRFYFGRAQCQLLSFRYTLPCLSWSLF